MKRLTDKQIMPILNRLRPASIFHVRSLGRDFKRDVFPLLQAQLDQDEIDGKAECQQRVKDERQRILSMGWKKFLKELETELDERCFG